MIESLNLCNNTAKTLRFEPATPMSRQASLFKLRKLGWYLDIRRPNPASKAGGLYECFRFLREKLLPHPKASEFHYGKRTKKLTLLHHDLKAQQSNRNALYV